jgi:hypothetical protein
MYIANKCNMENSLAVYCKTEYTAILQQALHLWYTVPDLFFVLYKIYVYYIMKLIHVYNLFIEKEIW